MLKIPNPIVLALLTLSASMLLGVGSAKAQFTAAATGVTAKPDDVASMAKVRIGPGDLLEVNIFDVPEMSQTVRVNDVGDVTLSLIGTLRLAGMSIDEAQKCVALQYASGHFLLDPQVSILIREYVTQGVSVFGEVTRPGVYPVLGRRTLFDILAAAGGITQLASSQVSVKRSSDGTIQTIAVSGQKIDSLSSDMVLEPGDRVLVPRAGIVYIIGEVNRPGGFVMQNDGQLSLLQAIAMALGTRNTAALSKVRLIRKTDTGYIQKPVPLKRILKGEEADWQLQAEDILYIPNSTARSPLFRDAPAAIQAASSAAIYRVM